METCLLGTALGALDAGGDSGDEPPDWFWDATEPIYLEAVEDGAVVDGIRTAYW